MPRLVATLSSIALPAAMIASVMSQPPAYALDFTANGKVLYVTGPVKSGDDIKFREIYQTVKGAIRIVDLNSSGGNIAAARAIGDVIRADGLTTLVDAKRSICASACTVLFLSGVARHYVNAGGIVDGVGPKHRLGLGFHEGNNPLSPGANHYSGVASAGMIAAYYAYGVGSAASLLTQSPPEKLNYVSAATAQSMGIATSLTSP